MKRIKWWIYTVLIGLIPFAIRLTLFLILKNVPDDYYLNEVDIVTFGLVLLISNFSELEDQPNINDKFKALVRGVLIFFLIMLSIFLGMSYYLDFDKGYNLDRLAIKKYTVVLSGLSFLISVAIYYNPNFQKDEV